MKETLKKWLLPSSEDQITTTKKKEVKEEKEEERKKKRKSPRVFTLITYQEAQEIARFLLGQQPVIVNVNRLSLKDKYRVIDFLSGVIFALDGERVKLDANIYLFSNEKGKE